MSHVTAQTDEEKAELADLDKDILRRSAQLTQVKIFVINFFPISCKKYLEDKATFWKS
jgi:hypothetical protein